MILLCANKSAGKESLDIFRMCGLRWIYDLHQQLTGLRFLDYFVVLSCCALLMGEMIDLDKDAVHLSFLEPNFISFL